MPQKNSYIHSFDKNGFSPKPNPLRELESGTKQIDGLRSNKININLDNRPEHKEEIHKPSEAKDSDPPR